MTPDGKEREDDGAGGAGDGDYGAVDDAEDRVDQAADDDAAAGAVGQPVQLGTAGTLPTQLLGVLAVMGELVVVMVPPWR